MALWFECRVVLAVLRVEDVFVPVSASNLAVGSLDVSYPHFADR